MRRRIWAFGVLAVGMCSTGVLTAQVQHDAATQRVEAQHAVTQSAVTQRVEAQHAVTHDAVMQRVEAQYAVTQDTVTQRVEAQHTATHDAVTQRVEAQHAVTQDTVAQRVEAQYAVIHDVVTQRVVVQDVATQDAAQQSLVPQNPVPQNPAQQNPVQQSPVPQDTTTQKRPAHSRFKGINTTTSHFGDSAGDLRGGQREDTLMSKMEEFAELYGELMAYNEEYGPLFSWEELNMLPAYDTMAAGWLRSQIGLWRPGQSEPFRLGELLRRGRQLVLLRTKARSAEDWEPGATLFYRFASGSRLQWGLTLDHDAGEVLFSRGIWVDFASFHLQISRIGAFKRIVIGDYTVRFGQGLVAWNGFSISGLGPVQNLRRSEMGLTAYTGSNEEQFFRGAGATFEWRRMQVTLFGSAKKRDARITSDGFTSLLHTGLHRTETELERRHNLGEYVTGGNLSCRFDWLKIGATALGYTYDHKNATAFRPDNRYQSRRQPFGSASIDGLAVWGDWRVFGEWAVDARAQMAGLFGILWDGGDGLEAGLLYRKYGKGYTAPFSGAYSRNSKPFNEHALTGSFEYAWMRWRLLCSGEWCYFPWMRFNVAAPSKSVTATAQLSRNMGRNALASLRIDVKHSETGSRLPLVESNRIGFRLHTQYGVGETWLFLHRVEYCLLMKSDVTQLLGGAALLLDAIYSPKKRPVSGSARIALFRTTDWSTRIYAYERDAMQGFSFPPLYGYGVRGYVNVRYTVSRSFDLWLRGSVTRYLSAKHPSASAPTGKSLWEPEVKLQVRVSW